MGNPMEMLGRMKDTMVTNYHREDLAEIRKRRFLNAGLTVSCAGLYLLTMKDAIPALPVASYVGALTSLINYYYLGERSVKRTNKLIKLITSDVTVTLREKYQSDSAEVIQAGLESVVNWAKEVGLKPEEVLLSLADVNLGEKNKRGNGDTERISAVRRVISDLKNEFGQETEIFTNFAGDITQIVDNWPELKDHKNLVKHLIDEEVWTEAGATYDENSVETIGSRLEADWENSDDEVGEWRAGSIGEELSGEI
jgi:hypothetical protein